MTLLPTETFDFSDGHAFHAETGKGFFHFFELEGLDDGLDFFHVIWETRFRTVRAADITKSSKKL